MGNIEDVLSEQWKPEKIKIPAKEIFWTLVKDQIKILRLDFIESLQHYGFCKIHHLGNFHLARIQDNIVSIKKKVEIKDFLLGRIKSYSSKMDEEDARSVLGALIKGSNIYFGEDNLSSLETVKFRPLKSTKKTAWFPFRNCVVKITAKSIELVQYSQISNHVLETQIIDRDFDPLPDQVTENFNFYWFLFNIIGKNQDRLLMLCSYIGFILHPHRDPANPQLLVCYDQQISDSPEGGTGKGILSQSFSQFKKTVFLDGKNFNFNGQFAWQRLSIDTQLVVFQDTNKWFKFDRLHSVLTDGISVNKKGKDEFFLEYTDSPKFVLNTNFVLDAEGDTNKRRMKELEFAPYYSAKLTPQDEFGELLFYDWSKEDWSKFDNLMLWCCQLYIDRGFIDMPSINKDRRLFLQKYGEDMLSFIENLPCGEKLRKLETFKKYKNYMGDGFPKKMTNRSFYQGFSKGCLISDVIQLKEEDKDKGGNYWIITKKSTYNDER